MGRKHQAALTSPPWSKRQNAFQYLEAYINKHQYSDLNTQSKNYTREQHFKNLKQRCTECRTIALRVSSQSGLSRG